MKHLKYFFVMAFLASVGSVSAFAQATGESDRPNCPAGADGNPAPEAAVVTGPAPVGVEAGTTEAAPVPAPAP